MNCDMTRRSALTGLAATTLLAPACRSSERRLDADVIVIGAGLSGLYAAMLLEGEGFDVQVVEALPRVGGRMFTLNHDDGYTEGGGQQIGTSYARILDVAVSLGVPLYSETGRGPDTAHYLNGQWEAGSFTVPQFPDAFQSTPPSSVLFRLLASEPGFESSESWLDSAPEFDVSARQFLTERGFAPDAQTLVERTLNANDLDTYSMLNLHRTWQLFRQSGGMGASQYVEGGSQRLPEAMAASLARPVRISSPVDSLKLGASYCEIRMGKASLLAPYAICALPLPALRRIDGLESRANAALSEALSALPYTQILQIHMQSQAPFWDVDTLAPSMWTNTNLERIFADSARDGSLTGFYRGWINGLGVKAWTALGQEVAQQQYIAQLAELRPSTDGALTPLAYVDWTDANPYAGGAYYHWKPGQAGRLARKMGNPIANLHFAGEHLGILHTGMEAAMESGERAALAIIEEMV